jgi:hypothetical protein
MSKLQKTIVNRVKGLCEERKLSTYALANRAGIPGECTNAKGVHPTTYQVAMWTPFPLRINYLSPLFTVFKTYWFTRVLIVFF